MSSDDPVAPAVCYSTCREPGSQEGQASLNEVFGQFLSFCEIEYVTRTETFTLGNGLVTKIPYIFENQVGATSTVSNNTTSTSSPTGTAAGAGETSSALTPPSPTSSPDPDSEQSSSKAWIAGAVVGPLVGLALLFILVFWLRRRRRQQPISPPVDAVPHSSTMDKAQLHSDSISPYKYAVEVDSGQVHELDASIRPAEFPANETPAHELPDKAHKREG